MSDIIQLLPDSVANQIAAGEVIQRPASVIKELVENAVDAGATVIHVSVIDAGRTSIQVIDDGSGMSETDARLSFERHATSKIRQAADLFSLHTMGFRGEALASIAAVAQVELKTRLATEEVGTHLSISGSRTISQEPCACPVGSNFHVDNLFFNVPARRKFLKSNATELNNIITSFERIALVYPEIEFTLHSNGTEIFNLKKGNLRQRIIDIFGKKLNQDLLPMGVDTTICKIHGFVGTPESAKKKGAHQYLFVNGRYMKHAYFHKAVQNAFERLVPTGEQVPYFIYFDVVPESIDVNIHPTKTEIKFEGEQAIWQILHAAVKEAIGIFNDVPSIDFDTQDKPEIPVFDSSRQINAPKISYNPQYNPFKSNGGERRTAATDWQQLYQGLNQGHPSQQNELFAPVEDTTQENIIDEKSPVHYQYKGQYIMTAVKSGLMIIDQHRAHVRILYEQYLSQREKQKGNAQKVLFPERIQLTAAEELCLNKTLPEMEKIGLELTDLGAGNYVINAIPATLEGVNATTLVKDMIVSAMEQENNSTDQLFNSMALSMARNAAIPYGQILGNDEMEHLINNLFTCSNVNYTPDGKKILAIMKQEEMKRLLE